MNQQPDQASIGPVNGELTIRKEDLPGGVVVLELEGVIVTKSRKQLQAAVEGLLEEEKDRIALDFGRVAHLDSTGMGTLLVLDNLLKRRGMKLKVYSASQMIVRFFQTSGLHRVLSLYTDQKAALEDDWHA